MNEGIESTKANSEAKRERTLVRAQWCGIHSLAEDLDGKVLSLLEGETVLLVLLSQDTLGTGRVGANACCLPSCIVARGVRVVQLESVVLIPSSINERHSERTQTYSSYWKDKIRETVNVPVVLKPLLQLLEVNEESQDGYLRIGCILAWGHKASARAARRACLRCRYRGTVVRQSVHSWSRCWRPK